MDETHMPDTARYTGDSAEEPDYITEWQKGCIRIGRCVREWGTGTSQAILIYNPVKAGFEVLYSEFTEAGGYRWSKIPTECVRNWLSHFCRPQGTLQEDSYYIKEGPHPAWEDTLRNLCGYRARPSLLFIWDWHIGDAE